MAYSSSSGKKRVNMKTWGTFSSVVVAGLVAACAPLPATVPVAGPPSALRQLEGEWVGEYSRGVGDREGGLYFRLAAGDEVALGDVWMNLRGQGPPPYQISSPAVSPLAIRFVWIEEDFVSGTLEPYEDPETKCILLTTFRGRLERDLISGTFVTENKTTGQMTSGIWSAKRTEKPAAGLP
jgi:hypothetical protein